MLDPRYEPLQAKLPCYGLVQVSGRVHKLAQAKVAAHETCVRLTDGAPLPLQPYIQAEGMQQLQASKAIA